MRKPKISSPVTSEPPVGRPEAGGAGQRARTQRANRQNAYAGTDLGQFFAAGRAPAGEHVKRLGAGLSALNRAALRAHLGGCPRADLESARGIGSWALSARR